MDPEQRDETAPAGPLADLASNVAAGDGVDWDGTRSSHPELEPMLHELQNVETLMRGHRDALGEPVSAATAGVGPSENLAWGPMRLLERLGAGSFGEVHRAFDPTLRIEVALKLLRPEKLASVQVFLDEARRHARVRHENVVRVLGADVHDGRPGIWFDLVHGETLEAELARRGPFAAGEATLCGIELCRALAAVHAAGLVHRDVKSTNVMREEGGRIVLMDFGSGVEHVADDAVAPGDALRSPGTPYWMAPEQLAGAPSVPTADLYALGVLLFRLVSRRFPVEASSYAELREHHARGERRSLRDLRPELPAGFVAVVERALDPDPSRRFASAGAMEQALRAALPATDPVAPTPARGPGTLLVLGIALTLALATAFAWSRWRVTKTIPAPVPAVGDAAGPAPAAGARATASPPPPAPRPLTATAELMRDAPGGPQRLSGGDAVGPGAGLYLRIEGPEAMHVYVLDEDDSGHAYVLFPVAGLDASNPLAAGAPHRLPGSLGGRRIDWQVTSAGGHETIVVLASREPLADLEREISSFPHARIGQPVAYGAIDPDRIGRVRGIGGMTDAPQPRRQTGQSALSELVRRIHSDPDARGPWTWQIQLENPAR